MNIASVAGIETIPHRSPAYAAAKAGLIRFTTAYDGPARVNCIVPGWIATPRGLREAAAMTDAERAAAGPMVAMEDGGSIEHRRGHNEADAAVAALRSECSVSRKAEL